MRIVQDKAEQGGEQQDEKANEMTVHRLDEPEEGEANWHLNEEPKGEADDDNKEYERLQD